jgi:hypothetical protein
MSIPSTINLSSWEIFEHFMFRPSQELSSGGYIIIYVKFEVYTAVTMKNGFWDVTPCGSCKEPHGVTSQKTHILYIIIYIEFYTLQYKDLQIAYSVCKTELHYTKT